MRVVLDFVQPVGQVLEWPQVSNIKHQDGGNWPFIICSRNWLEWLLASRVPDLDLDGLLAQVEHLGPELNAQGGLVLALEPALEEPHEDTWLPNIYGRMGGYCCRRWGWTWVGSHSHFGSFLEMGQIIIIICSQSTYSPINCIISDVISGLLAAAQIWTHSCLN